jgi:isopenicillin N synthase-like dioxygenase
MTIKQLNIDKKLTVSAHADPGLFAISLISTSSGLQMLDKRNQNRWVDVPIGQSVIWAGASAHEVSNGIISPGWHRVTRNNHDDSTPRSTM